MYMYVIACAMTLTGRCSLQEYLLTFSTCIAHHRRTAFAAHCATGTAMPHVFVSGKPCTRDATQAERCSAYSSRYEQDSCVRAAVMSLQVGAAMWGAI